MFKNILIIQMYLNHFKRILIFFCTVLPSFRKKVNRKIQGVPQSQAAANPWHQEEEKKDRNLRVPNKQTNAQEAHRPALSSTSDVCFLSMDEDAKSTA